MEVGHRISLCTPLMDGRLHLEFTDGSSGTVDLRPHLLAGGVFAPMADPDGFAAVQVERRGRSLAWPCGVDLCADALWLEVHGMESQVEAYSPREAS